MAVTLVKLIKMIIVYYNQQLQTKLYDQLNKKHFEKIFLWAFAWSIGGTLVNVEIAEKCLAELFPVDILPRGSPFNYIIAIVR